MFTKPALPELSVYILNGRQVDLHPWSPVDGGQGVSQIVLYPALGDKILPPKIYYLPEHLPGLNKQKEPWGLIARG